MTLCKETFALQHVISPVDRLKQIFRLFLQGNATRSSDPVVNAANARALGNALVAFLVIPWSLSLIFYSGKPCSHRFATFTLYSELHKPVWSGIVCFDSLMRDVKSACADLTAGQHCSTS